MPYTNSFYRTAPQVSSEHVDIMLLPGPKFFGGGLFHEIDDRLFEG